MSILAGDTGIQITYSDSDIDNIYRRISNVEISVNGSHKLSKKVISICDKSCGVFGKSCLGVIFTVIGGTALYLITQIISI